MEKAVQNLILPISLAILLVAVMSFTTPVIGAEGADLVLTNGSIWTGNPEQPWADWIAIEGERIAAVGKGKAPAGKRIIDLQSRLTVPGFNDSHVHFASAGALLLGVNLLDVNDDEMLRGRLREAVVRFPKGSWITGGNWGAYEAHALGSA